MCPQLCAVIITFSVNTAHRGKSVCAAEHMRAADSWTRMASAELSDPLNDHNQLVFVLALSLHSTTVHTGAVNIMFMVSRFN